MRIEKILQRSAAVAVASAKAGVLRRQETECGFEEGHGEIRRAGGSVAGNGTHEQR